MTAEEMVALEAALMDMKKTVRVMQTNIMKIQNRLRNEKRRIRRAVREGHGGEGSG